jgi:hypothetical protein
MIDPEVRGSSIPTFPQGNIQPLKIEIRIFIFTTSMAIFKRDGTSMFFCVNPLQVQMNLNLNLHLSV